MSSDKEATARASPATVLLDPSTSAEPQNFTVRDVHPLQTNTTFIDPPRPVGSTLAGTRIPVE